MLSSEKSAASINFERGLNVVSGASNTGKSYLFGLLNFMCGSAGPLDAIPEAEGYREVEAVIEHDSGATYTLRRSVLGGDFTVVDARQGSSTTKVLGERLNSNDPDNISTFLLDLSELAGKKIRKNADNELQNLSFRNLAHLVLVDEETVIKKASPLHGKEPSAKTVESNIFKLLLSGEDDAKLVANKKRAIAKAELQAQADLLQGLILDYEEELAEQTKDASDLEAQLARLDGSVDAAYEEVLVVRQNMQGTLTLRQETWEVNRGRVARRRQVLSLLARFALLDEHYTSDLLRLDAIAEAGSLFPPMEAEICPLCGSPRGGHSHPEEQGMTVDVEEVRRSCESEKQKISLLRQELVETSNRLQFELAELDVQIEEGAQALQRISEEIQEVLKASVSDAETTYNELVKTRFHVKQAFALLVKIEGLRDKQAAALSGIKTAGKIKAVRAEIPPARVETFRTAFTQLLTSWKFPVDGTVIFDLKDEDFILGSRRRKAHGKGSRALTHAAFSIGLMNTCMKSHLPHPGFVAIDSPLVTFRDSDAGENPGVELTGDQKARVRDFFYQDLASRTGDNQVIIFENEEPSLELRPSINFHHFSGDASIPRAGFFPSDVATNFNLFDYIAE